MTECSENTCGIVDNMDLTRSTTAEKKAMAAALYKTGKWTMKVLAKKFGVTKQAVSLWLLSSELDNQKPAKTASNPKGSGRHKKRLSPKTERLQEAVVELVRKDKPVSREKLAREYGVAKSSVQHAHNYACGIVQGESVQIRTEDLSLTAQRKLEIAMHQRECALEQEFDQRVMKEVERRMDTMVLPSWKKHIDWAKAVRQRKEGILTVAEYRLLRSCMHPDRVQDDDLKRKFSEAFHILERMEKFLCEPEKEPPAKFPRTWQEAQSFA